jgi:hypothetical protein
MGCLLSKAGLIRTAKNTPYEYYYIARGLSFHADTRLLISDAHLSISTTSPGCTVRKYLFPVSVLGEPDVAKLLAHTPYPGLEGPY